MVSPNHIHINCAARMDRQGEFRRRIRLDHVHYSLLTLHS